MYKYKWIATISWFPFLLIVVFVISNFINDPVCIDRNYLQKVIIRNKLTTEELRFLAHLLDNSSLWHIISNINIIRPVNSNNHKIVEQFITTQLKDLDWDIKYNNFTENTVIGTVNFTNIIAINKSFLPRNLVLACHYDSKMIQGFYGTIDSAIPCAIMLNIAKTLNVYLKEHRSNIALQLIFFDGEEAFNTWTDTDSIYGARHLAAKMYQNGIQCNELSKIDLLVLLDLLGAKDSYIPMYEHCNQQFYQILFNIENLAKSANLLTSSRFANSGASFFRKRIYPGIEDDHLPFIDKSVPVLHLIPFPFPKQWHTLSDTIENVDADTIRDLQLLIAAYVCEYLQLDLTEPLPNIA